MIGIVGGGITGLLLAHALDGAGVDFRVFETAAEPGGVIRSRIVDGRVLELGPQRTRWVGPLRTLVGELGLREALILAPEELPLYVYDAGKLRRAPLTPGAALATDLLSWRGKARVLLEPLTAGERPGESVGAFLTRKLGREAYERLVGPLYGGLYGSDPHEMHMRHTLSEALRALGVQGSLLGAFVRSALRRGSVPPACSFRDGLQTLPRALFERHRDRIHLDAPVEAIERAGARYRVRTRQQSLDATAVVLTPPADVAARLLRPIAPDAADRLARLRYNPLAIVHLRSDFERAGMGYQVALTEDLVTRGVTWNASLFGRDGVYTAFLGGAKNPWIVDEDDDAIGATAAAEFERVTGRSAEVMRVSRVRMPAWDTTWSALEGLELPSGIHLAANYESRAGIAGRMTRAKQVAERLQVAG